MAPLHVCRATPLYCNVQLLGGKIVPLHGHDVQLFPGGKLFHLSDLFDAASFSTGREDALASLLTGGDGTLYLDFGEWDSEIDCAIGEPQRISKTVVAIAVPHERFNPADLCEAVHGIPDVHEDSTFVELVRSPEFFGLRLHHLPPIEIATDARPRIRVADVRTRIAAAFPNVAGEEVYLTMKWSGARVTTIQVQIPSREEDDAEDCGNDPQKIRSAFEGAGTEDEALAIDTVSCVDPDDSLPYGISMAALEAILAAKIPAGKIDGTLVQTQSDVLFLYQPAAQ